jgi:hypothetical protein
MGPHLVRWPGVFVLICAVSCTVSRGWAAAPTLYRQPAYQSPASAEPDDLLLIPGYGFSADDRVVYEAVESRGASFHHPERIPAESTADQGIADVASFSNIPYSLTVRLPRVMRAGQSYALWVVNAAQEWSEPARINDARPLWLSPGFVYATQAVASLPRYLKVMGRNLEPGANAVTEMRLSGPAELIFEAEHAPAGEADVDHFVALAKLPARLIPGDYHVQVRRDRSGWVDLPDQSLRVRPDSAHLPEFKVSAAEFGGCRANDGQDDAPCILRAIKAAEAAGGGTLVFDVGTWILSEKSTPPPNGILIPRNVSLRGAGKYATTIVQGAGGASSAAQATFTLMGGNTVEGATFRDAHVYGPEYVRSSFLKLGVSPDQRASSSESFPAPSVDDVVITQNIFDRPNVAISDSGLAIRRLFVTYNEFGAYRMALDLGGNRYLVHDRFGIEDSVIAYNIFKPGSYIATDIRQGTMASQMGGSMRVDFSHNVADGTATDYLYADKDARGWRAAFFWLMNDNDEMLLVSQNTATCTGDKDGDGEAISYDNNANTFALPRPATVLRATADSITVQGPLMGRQNDLDVRVGDYYLGHWIQVGEGPGLGQVRKIRSYREDSATGAVIFKISPDWDVIPVEGMTRINVGREFWQVYTIANTVDQRTPLCQKSNRTGPHGGGISTTGQIADSVIEGNRQYDTDGIFLRMYYNAQQESCSVCNSETGYVDFLDIRDNLIEGEYAWGDDCSSSGIFGSLAAAPAMASPPTTVAYGLSIAHNTIAQADGRRGGAISLVPTWYEGPSPHRWPLVDNALVYHNAMSGLNAAPARPCAGTGPHPRTAISLGASALVPRTVLYANVCPDARRPLDVRESDVVKVCEPAAGTTCECPSMSAPP